MEEPKKKVDEEWKKQVQKEKERGQGVEEKREEVAPEASFPLFITTLATQALIHLGEAKNPITGRVEKNLDQARFTIDTLQIIEEKTRGNLTEQESRLLKNILYDLQMRYVRVAPQERKPE